MHTSARLALASSVVLFTACGGSDGPDGTGPGPDTPNAPPSLFAAGIAFDHERDRVIVTGGDGSAGPTAATWEWSGTAWTRTATTGPSARMWASMVYDPDRRRTVLFGGLAGTSILGDTWEYDGAAWRQLSATGPSARYAHEMVYDVARRRVVLVGGRNAATPLSDVWEFDGSAWHQVAATALTARFALGLAFDVARERTVAFGGYGPTTGGTQQSLAGTWTRANADWEQRTGTEPSARDHVAMVYDAGRQRVVLYGGISSEGGSPRQLLETWEWDGTAWSQRATTGPTPNGNHRLVYDSRRNRVLLWTDAAATGDRTEMWTWNGTAWTRVAEFSP